MENQKPYDWENPNVNLNLYDIELYGAGQPEAIKTAKFQINRFLHSQETDSNTNLTEKEKLQNKIYKFLLNAISYYEQIAITPENEFKSVQTFKEIALKELELEYKYLVEMYNDKFPNDPPTIKLNIRIKSFFSFLYKAMKQIDKYYSRICSLSEEKTDSKNNNSILSFDFNKILDDLHDIFGVEYIVSPPKSRRTSPIQDQEFLSEFSIELMKYHNYTDSSKSEYSKLHDIKFQKVPAGKVKTCSIRGYDRKRKIWIAPIEIDPQIDMYRRNYVQNPKQTGYQSYHLYGTLNPKLFPAEMQLQNDSDAVHKKKFIEWHIFTDDMYEYQTIGPARREAYKLYETMFTRLALPLNYEIRYDNTTNTFEIKEYNAEERIIKMYGLNHNDLFGIPFNIFVQLRASDQNDIYSLKKSISRKTLAIDPQNDELLYYDLVDSQYDKILIQSPELFGINWEKMNDDSNHRTYHTSRTESRDSRKTPTLYMSGRVRKQHKNPPEEDLCL